MKKLVKVNLILLIIISSIGCSNMSPIRISASQTLEGKIIIGE